MTDDEIADEIRRIAVKPMSFSDIGLEFFKGRDAADRDLFRRFWNIARPMLAAVPSSPGTYPTLYFAKPFSNEPQFVGAE